jgi:hypothetical protein
MSGSCTITRSLTLVAGTLIALGLSVCATPRAEALVVDGAPLPIPAKSYVGAWNGSTAIAIGPRAVLTAKHVQGYATQQFLMDGVYYPVKAIHQNPSADLQIIELTTDLPGWHQLATSVTPGQRVTVAGNGFVAGTESTKGYTWSSARTETWGMNTVDSVTSWYLVTKFNSTAPNPSEATFATYDSGGGVFIEQPGGTLELAGIIVSVSSSTGFSAYGDRGYSVNLVPQAAWMSPFVAAPCPGDLNGDRRVNVRDFSLMAKSFGAPNGGLGDMDGDGDCDITDFNAMNKVMGTICP